MIELVNITKSYVYGEHKTLVLKGLTMRIHAGTFLAIMGPSGSGKSTLLNILGCLDRPDSGEYYLDGVLVNSIPPVEWAHLRNEKIGFVFQQFNLLQGATLLENVNLPSLYRREEGKSGRQAARYRAVKLLHSVGLHGFENYIPSKISGGQQQRVAIARALLNDPVILLADEPTGNLDVRSSLEIMNIFQSLNGQGKTIIMITHEPDIAEHASKNVTLVDGRIVKERFVEHPRIAALELERYEDRGGEYGLRGRGPGGWRKGKGHRAMGQWEGPEAFREQARLVEGIPGASEELPEAAKEVPGSSEEVPGVTGTPGTGTPGTGTPGTGSPGTGTPGNGTHGNGREESKR